MKFTNIRILNGKYTSELCLYLIENNNIDTKNKTETETISASIIKGSKLRFIETLKKDIKI